MMKVDLSNFSDDGELVNAIVSGATLRVVQQSQRTSFAGANHRMSADDTLDIVKIVIVGNSGVGKDSKGGANNILDLFEKISHQMPVLLAVPTAVGFEPKVVNEMAPSDSHSRKLGG